MTTLLLRLAGPMQSWGTTSMFDERDTSLEPSKSGVIGLICAALGRDRTEPIDDLAALRMGVRVDREGLLMRDYQTILGILSAAGKFNQSRSIISPRYYLADAVFLVGLEGEERLLLERIQEALRAPHWPLFLGRKSYPPSMPVWLEDCLRDEPLMEALRKYPPLVPWKSKTVRLIIEDQKIGSMRLDQPVAPFSERRFGPRFVRMEVIHVPE